VSTFALHQAETFPLDLHPMAPFTEKLPGSLTLVDRVGGEPMENGQTMATNSFIEFRLVSESELPRHPWSPVRASRDPQVVLMVIVVTIVGLLILVPLSHALANRGFMRPVK
jgi:hypothetical protein